MRRPAWLLVRPLVRLLGADSAGPLVCFGTLLAACTSSGGGADAGVSPWPRELPPSSVMGQSTAGLRAARGIVHLHSPYSHDACDGKPRPGGVPDETCLGHLRDALCATRMDFAALTDHDDSMADEPWGPALFLYRPGDELLFAPDGTPYANRIACGNGHSVLLTVGGENALMPLMLDRHPDGDAAARHAAYDSDGPSAVTVFRALGGLAWIAHTESKALDHLRALGLDGLEIFNLHAAIDPDIREEHLGLPGETVASDIVKFADRTPEGPEPDLAVLPFLVEQEVSVARWQALLFEGQRIAATAGTDAHENSFPLEMRDGERGDSYRRMLRWFSNVVLVDDPADPAQIEAALDAGRAFVAFEILGTPVGFDFRIEEGAMVAQTPAVFGVDAALPAPEIRTRILRIAQGGNAEEVAAGVGSVVYPAPLPGVYRAEVRIRPRHLSPYLGGLGPELAEREYVWIYSNALWIE